MDNSKYKTYLKKVKARVIHRCMICNNIIVPRELYYRETNEDKHLQTPHAKKFCSNCYQKYGDNLLKARTQKSARLHEFKTTKGPLNNYLQLHEVLSCDAHHSMVE